MRKGRILRHNGRWWDESGCDVSADVEAICADRLAALEREADNDEESPAVVDWIAALERENARLRAVIADLLETDANWTAAADWNAALERAREALEGGGA